MLNASLHHFAKDNYNLCSIFLELDQILNQKSFDSQFYGWTSGLNR